jgi:selenocysteine-specific elongation factor
MGVIVGTAGHIDHGKSQLVKYLTGTDPDRLKEEKERGITIELGYVFMPLPQGGLLAFIDVPGHENFIRQMVAGTATVDCFLLVVAADEGIMPQTREHLDILKLLGVHRGVVAVTKCDLVDSEMQELVEVEIEELFEDSEFQGTPVYRVSSLTGEGMDELRDALVRMAMDTGQRQTGDRFRLDIDRVFVLEGFGTIVAGTAISGTVKPGQEVELMPGGGRYRVREIRVNSRNDVPEGTAGDRIALNLVGLAKEDVDRGSCIAEPGYLQARDSLDTSFTMVGSAPPLKRYQRVRFHTGTAEVMARAVPVEGDSVAPGMTEYVHFQLESQVAALPGDRFVIRSYSPIITIGGGTILETGTRKVRRKYSGERVSHLEVLETGSLDDILLELVEDSGTEGVTAAEASEGTPYTVQEVLERMRILEEEGSIVTSGKGDSTRAVKGSAVEDAAGRLLNSLARHHERSPVSPGIPLSEPSRILKGYPQWLVRTILERLQSSGQIQKRGERLALAEHPPEIPDKYREAVRRVMEEVDGAGDKGMQLSDIRDGEIAGALVERSDLHLLAEGIVVTGSMSEKLFDRAREGFRDGLTLAELRDLMGVSRKDALRWAELFDSLGWTVRRGDRRFLSGS